MADDGLTPYERERAKIIAANQERLRALGLAGAAASLGLGPAPGATPKPTPQPKRVAPSLATAPRRSTRSSKRLRGEAADVKPDPSPPASPSPSPPPKWTAEQLRQMEADKEASRVARMDERLGELDLAGLIAFGPGTRDDVGPPSGADPPRVAATFAVVGAKHKGARRKHYVVHLAAGPSGHSHRCECLDYRFRHKTAAHYACKHIRLVHTQLGCADEPAGWEAAVERRVMGR